MNKQLFKCSSEGDIESNKYVTFLRTSFFLCLIIVLLYLFTFKNLLIFFSKLSMVQRYYDC